MLELAKATYLDDILFGKQSSMERLEVTITYINITIRF
jgi:hypothetical protein